MQKYLRISLLSSSLFFALLSFGQSILTLDENGEGVFDMQIDRKDDHFSGILSVKKESDSAYRFALVSKMGGTLLDMRILTQSNGQAGQTKGQAEPNSGQAEPNTGQAERSRSLPTEVLFCIEPLNRKPILKMLERDFRLLIWNFKPTFKPGQKVRIGKKKYRVWTDPCINNGVRSWKTVFNVRSNEDCELIEAKISHPGLRLHLTVTPYS